MTDPRPLTTPEDVYEACLGAVANVRAHSEAWAALRALRSRIPAQPSADGDGVCEHDYSWRYAALCRKCGAWDATVPRPSSAALTRSPVQVDVEALRKRIEALILPDYPGHERSGGYNNALRYVLRLFSELPAADEVRERAGEE